MLRLNSTDTSSRRIVSRDPSWMLTTDRPRITNFRGDVREPMLIFWRLVLAHFIADFTLQTNKVAQWKRVSRWGMVVHVLCHPLMYLLFCWNYLPWPWVRWHGLALNGWTCIVLIVLLHWLEDEARVWCIPSTWNARQPRPSCFGIRPSTWAFLLAFAPLLNGTHIEPWVLIAISAVLLAHFTSVFDFLRRKRRLRRLHRSGRHHKYAFMIERLSPGGSFPSSRPPGLPPSFLWMAGLLIQRTRGRLNRTWIHLAITLTVVLLAGFDFAVSAARFVIRTQFLSPLLAADCNSKARDSDGVSRNIKSSGKR